MTTRLKYIVRGFDMGEEPEERALNNYNRATEYYESIHYDVKQFLEHRDDQYHLTNQHVFGRMSWNINQ